MKKPGLSALTDEEKAEYARFLLTKNQVKKQPMITTGWPDPLWMLIPGLFGLPVERQQKELRNPVVILGFLGLFLLVYYLSEHDGAAEFATKFGFIPHLWFRHAFSSLITSFFIHGGLMHLVGNSYYLYVFGDDIEDELSFISFFVLIFGSHIAGLLVQAWMDGGGTTPIIGASAGISGLMGYYLTRFPRRQISYLFLLFVVVYWVHLPAFMALLLKFVWEFALAKTTDGNADGVAHSAQFAGALFGILFAWLTNKEHSRH